MMLLMMESPEHSFIHFRAVNISLGLHIWPLQVKIYMISIHHASTLYSVLHLMDRNGGHWAFLPLGSCADQVLYSPLLPEWR